MHLASRPALEDRVSETRARDRLPSGRSRNRPEFGRGRRPPVRTEMVRHGPDLRILAPNFFDIYVKPNLDLKHPLTIFDETRKKRNGRCPRRAQEDLGTIWAAVRRLRTGLRHKGQGPTWSWEDPKQAQIRQATGVRRLRTGLGPKDLFFASGGRSFRLSATLFRLFWAPEAKVLPRDGGQPQPSGV